MPVAISPPPAATMPLVFLKMNVTRVVGFGVICAIAFGCASSPVQENLSRQVLPFGRQYTPLMEAASLGDLAKVKTLVELGVNINQKNEFGWDALFFAIDASQKEIALYLLKNGADPKSREPPGRSKEWKRSKESSTTLLGGTALFMAVTVDSFEVVKELIERGADVTVREYYGSNALRYARSAEVAQLLIDHGLDPNTTSRAANGGDFDAIGSNSALILAAQEGRVGVMDVLLKAGANPNARGVLGATAMHFAAQFNQVEAMKRLLETGKVDVNATDGSETSLHWAVAYRKIDAVRFLLQAGADTSIRQINNQRRTPLELAKAIGTVDIANLIEQFSASLPKPKV